MTPAVALATLALLLPAVTPPTGILDEAATANAPAVRLNPPVCDTECLIRRIWPDPLEDRALRIAWRESRYQPRVHTWCCYGLFQIHQMHLRWLCPELGICTTADLYDPELNVAAAYALYERNGWQPWSTP